MVLLQPLLFCGKMCMSESVGDPTSKGMFQHALG